MLSLMPGSFWSSCVTVKLNDCALGRHEHLLVETERR